jgi:GTPase SAR1 family protein
MSRFKIKIIYYSAGSVRKSVPIKKYIDKGFTSNYQVSIGVNVYVKEVEYTTEDIATLSFWDIGEQEKFKFLRKSLLKGTYGAILEFDLSKISTFEEVKTILAEARKITSKKVPFILIGNADLGRSIDREEIHSYVVEEGGIYLESSDKTEENLDKALTELTREIIDTFVLSN